MSVKSETAEAMRQINADYADNSTKQEQEAQLRGGTFKVPKHLEGLGVQLVKPESDAQ